MLRERYFDADIHTQPNCQLKLKRADQHGFKVYLPCSLSENFQNIRILGYLYTWILKEIYHFELGNYGKSNLFY